MANPKSPESLQAFIDQNPFEGFQISDNSILHTLEGRTPCPTCGKSRKYYCYTCYVPVTPELRNHLPKVHLPIKIDIIKHKHEIDGKSTAGHAAILAPDHVKIHTYPDIPDYRNEQVILIFPSQGAISINELTRLESYQQVLSMCKDKSDSIEKDVIRATGFHPGTLLKNANPDDRVDDLLALQRLDWSHLPITRAVFIDSTWNQSRGIYKDDRVKGIPCVVLQNRISQFWRHQKGSPRWYLSTIEAIHQFLVELHVNCKGANPSYKGISNCFSDVEPLKFVGVDGFVEGDNEGPYDGQYDNLLYFFKHMYDLIHAYYDHDKLYAYKRRLK